MAQLHRIEYGTQIISFELEYRKRKTLEISVYPDLSVKVKAPMDKTIEAVKDKIHKRASWIMEQKYFFSLYLPKQPEKQYISGETHCYLGKKYRLKIKTSDQEQVKLSRGEIVLCTRNRNASKRNKAILEKWYNDRAVDKFNERLGICMAKAQKHGIQEPTIQIRRMSKRWGSCSQRGQLILNTHLIKASSQCIDYVIMHELCHLKYFNHGSAFYKLFNRLMPDWEKRKKMLESMII